MPLFAEIATTMTSLSFPAFACFSIFPDYKQNYDENASNEIFVLKFIKITSLR